MSADNWRICPKCQESNNKQKMKKQEELDALYGKVSMAEYKKKQDNIDKLESVETPTEFREDYEIYSEGMTVYVEYSGKCRDCGFKFYKKVEWEMG